MAQSAGGDHLEDLVGRIFEEYLESLERGEEPRLEDYVERYPEIADVLRTVIPAFEPVVQTVDTLVADGKESKRYKQLGDFRILRQIGRGGMGIVYEAEQISMTRRVALKVLPLAGLVDELKIRRFQNEVRAVAALDHPNIVSVYMVGEERGVHYYAMQLIRGRSLSEVISSLRHVRDEGEDLDGASISQITNRGVVDDGAEADPDATMPTDVVGAVSHREAGAETIGTVAKADSTTISHSSRAEYFRSVATLGIQAATALQHAHEEGIIHRDIKPANLLLGSASILYVTDFGLARIESDAGVTMTGDLIGTLRYMAPEQALAKRVVVDQRVDIYALAATLYELLALRPAYLAEDRQELLRQIAFEEPVPLRRIDRDIPAELETIVHKAMSKDMDQRYASAQDLADDLRSHLENRPIQAKPPTTSEVIGKWTRRNPVLTWSAIVTLTLVTMTLVASTLVIAQKERKVRQVAEARRQELYAAQVNLAHQAWRDGDIERAQSLLALQRPERNQTDLRGFEWRYLWKLCRDESRATLVTLVTPTEGGVIRFESQFVSFSVDGSKLAIAEGKTIRVWGFASRRELRSLDVEEDRVLALSFSPADTDLLAISDGDKVALWDVTSSGPPSIVARKANAGSLAFSPNGKTLSWTSPGGRVELWDVETGTQTWSILGHWDANVPNGKRATHSLCVAFSPNGTLVASGGGDTKVRLWNAETGTEVGPPLEGHTGFVTSVDFSTDGRLLATAGFDGRVLVWDVATRLPRAEFLEHNGPVKFVGFSPDGETLVSCGNDSTIRCWDVAMSRQTNILCGHTGIVHSLAFSPDGQSLVSISDKTVKLWDAPPHVPKDILYKDSGWLNDVVLSPDGRMLAVHDFHAFAVNLWDVRSRSLIGHLPIDTYGAQALAISPDGKLLASGGADRVVRLWDLSKREATSLQCESGVHSLTFSSDGSILGAAGEDGHRFWNVASGREIELIRGDTHLIRRVAFAPRGRWLAALYHNGQMIVLDTDDAKELTSFPAVLGISAMSFSSDGALIAAGSHEGRITLFDVKREKIISGPQGHTSGVSRVAFTPDSKTLATASWDGTIKLWNIAADQITLTLQHIGPVTGVSFSNDGLLMVTSGADGTVRLWPAASLSEADASSRTR